MNDQSQVNYTTAWRNALNISGVATRAEYWWFALVNLVVMILLVALTALTVNEGGDLSSSIGFWLLLVFALIVLVPSFTAIVRRVRDATGSGLWTLLWLIPGIGGLIVLIITIMPSRNQM